jgi:hypothetical protein
MSPASAARPSFIPRRHKYRVLLGLLLVSIVIQTFGLHAGAAGVLSDIFRTLLSVTVFMVVFAGTRERAPVAVVLIAAIGVGWLRHFTGGSDVGALALTFNLLSSAFMWFAVWVILRDLLRTPDAGGGSVLGAICGYLIAADAWSGINICAYLLAPDSFIVDPSIREAMTHWHGRLAQFCYYSFSQMLMLGYANITPVAAPATTLSLFAALFGMFYTAVVVAQFVGLAQGASRDGA